MPEGFSPFMHPQWDGAVEIRGLTAAYDACGLGGDDRMRCTRSNGRVVEIGGVDGNVDACGLGGRGDRMRRTRSGGRVVIRFG